MAAFGWAEKYAVNSIGSSKGNSADPKALRCHNSSLRCRTCIPLRRADCLHFTQSRRILQVLLPLIRDGPISPLGQGIAMAGFGLPLVAVFSLLRE